MKSTILWNLYPELRSLTTSHPPISSSSTKFVDIACPCGSAILIAPVDLLRVPFCDECERCFLTSRMSIDDAVRFTQYAIQTSTTYFQFNELLARLPVQTRGDVQEIFAKYYFNAYRKHFDIAVYSSRLLGDKIPSGLSEKDMGSDAVIVHTSGAFSFVQVKFRSDWTASLHRNSLGGASLEALALPNFQKLYLFSNTVVPPKNISENEQSKIKYIMMTDLHNADWSRIQESVSAREGVIRSNPPALYDWQVKARAHVVGGPIDFKKKTVVAMCGAGKTVFGNSILTDFPSVLIIVPNLQLLGQWFERIASWNPDREFLLIGSDLDGNGCESIPYTLTTNPDVINSYSRTNLICVCTYQSLDLLKGAEVFDLAIVDEAHVTCGTGVSNFTLIHREELARNKLFLTATPKIYNVTSDDFVSMNDIEKFGEVYTYSCKEAIDDGIVSDYKIVIGHGVGSNHPEFNAKFLCESVKKHGLTSVLVCSVSHKASKELYDEVKKTGMDSHELLLMPANATSVHKNRAIGYANSKKPVIIFNVRVFSLGTDIPSLESVMILGDRKSVIDTVQTVSRCLRKYPGKDYGYILIPCLLSGEGDMEEEGDYLNVRRIISSMGSVDSALVETVVLRGGGAGRRGIVCSSVGTSEVVREGVAGMDFELELYDRLGEREFSVEFKFAKLVEFCTEHGMLPIQRYEWNGVKIGVFLNCLLSGKVYKGTRLDMLEQLKAVSDEIKTQVNERINNINDPQKKAHRTISVDTRFTTLLEFCKEYGRLPRRHEEWNGIKIGYFVDFLLEGKLDMLEQLKAVSDGIRTHIEKRLGNRANEKKKASRAIPVEKRLLALIEFCKENGRLPSYFEELNSVKIGSFLAHLFNECQFKGTRLDMLEQLKAVSDNIRTQVNERINNINDPQKKAHRTIPVDTRFTTLLEFCKEYGRLPKVKEEWKDVKIGGFLTSLIEGAVHKGTRLDMLEQLKAVSDATKTQVLKRLKIRDNRHDRTIPVDTQFTTLLEFCKEYGRLPKVKDEWKDVKVGVLLGNLLRGRRYKASRATYLDQLSQISPVIREAIESRAKQ